MKIAQLLFPYLLLELIPYKLIPYQGLSSF